MRLQIAVHSEELLRTSKLAIITMHHNCKFSLSEYSSAYSCRPLGMRLIGATGAPRRPKLYKRHDQQTEAHGQPTSNHTASRPALARTACRRARGSAGRTASGPHSRLAAQPAGRTASRPAERTASRPAIARPATTRPAGQRAARPVGQPNARPADQQPHGQTASRTHGQRAARPVHGQPRRGRVKVLPKRR